jgi:hypothetical protein
MTENGIDLAVAFGWMFGLRDHRIAAALGLPESNVRQRRVWMGLKKASGGRPVCE